MMKQIAETVNVFFEDYTRKQLAGKDVRVADSLQLKKDHSLRVARLSLQLAQKLKLDENGCELARIIGLLHDLGRFQQFEIYKTFDDTKSEDHAALSVSVLKEQDFFTGWPEPVQQLVTQVIELHNKAVATSSDDQVSQFSKILRDADKLDIWEICVSQMKRDGSFLLPSISYGLPNTPGVSELVIKALRAGKPVLKKDLHSVNDFKLFLLAMVYDLNFKDSFQLLNEKQLTQKIYDTLLKRDDVIEVYRQIRLFVENKFVA